MKLSIIAAAAAAFVAFSATSATALPIAKPGQTGAETSTLTHQVRDHRGHSSRNRHNAHRNNGHGRPSVVLRVKRHCREADAQHQMKSRFRTMKRLFLLSGTLMRLSDGVRSPDPRLLFSVLREPPCHLRYWGGPGAAFHRPRAPLFSHPPAPGSWP